MFSEFDLLDFSKFLRFFKQVSHFCHYVNWELFLTALNTNPQSCIYYLILIKEKQKGYIALNKNKFFECFIKRNYCIGI